MLTEKKRRAVDMLFEESEAAVAEKLKITRAVLKEWIAEIEFQEALGDEMRANRQSSARLLSRLYLNACKELDQIIHEKEDKNRHRIIVELLKVSGLLKESMLDESGGGADPIQAMLARIPDDDEDSEPPMWGPEKMHREE